MEQALIVNGYRVPIRLLPCGGPTLEWVTPDGAHFVLIEGAQWHIREAFRPFLPQSPAIWVDGLKCRYAVVLGNGTVDRWYETFDGAIKRRDVLSLDHGLIDVSVVPRIEHINKAHYPKRIGVARKGHNRGPAYQRRTYKYRRNGVVDKSKLGKKGVITEVDGTIPTGIVLPT